MSLALAVASDAAGASGARGTDVPTNAVVEIKRSLAAMLTVPAGTFIMGSGLDAQRAALRGCTAQVSPLLARNCAIDLFADEGPEVRVYLGGFAIDRVEVSVAAYRPCAVAGVCSPAPLSPPDARFTQSDWPVTSVTWSEADAYCRWRGGRLPSEAEWERAARGTDGRAWPWGNQEDEARFNHGRFLPAGEQGRIPLLRLWPDASDGYAFLAPVGSYAQGVSPVGALDMAGNVSEWTADYYADKSAQSQSTINPHGPATGTLRVVRGGSWRESAVFARTTSRQGLDPETRASEIGFRCAR